MNERLGIGGGLIKKGYFGKIGISVGRFDLSSLSHDLPAVSASGGE